MKRLPDSELELMLVIWEENRAMSRAEIEEKLKEKNSDKSLSRTTVFSFLSRLEEKEFVSVSQKGKKNYYTALVSKEEYQEFEGKSILGKMFGNSLKNFVASMCDGKAVPEEDIEELKCFIEQYDEKK